MSGKAAKAERRRIRQEMEEAAAGPAYWHGGPDGLAVGDVVQPITRLLSLAADTRSAHPWFDDLEHNHVYATFDRSVARGFAARWSAHMLAASVATLTADGVLPKRNPWRSVPRDEGGTLYRVQPLGAVSHDPDYPRGISFRMPQARVIAVEETGIPFSIKPTPDVLAYTKWDTGERLWDDEGHVIPNAQMRARGLTTEDFRPLGYAPDAFDILQRANQVLIERGHRP